MCDKWEVKAYYLW